MMNDVNDAICFIFFSPRETWSQASRHVPMLDVLIGTKSSKNCKPRRKAKLLYFIAALPNWARFWSSNVTNLGLTIAKKTSKYIWNNLEGIIVNFVVYILIYDHHYLLNNNSYLLFLAIDWMLLVGFDPCQLKISRRLSGWRWTFPFLEVRWPSKHRGAPWFDLGFCGFAFCLSSAPWLPRVTGELRPCKLRRRPVRAAIGHI